MKPAEPPAPEPEEPVIVPDTVDEVDWDTWKFTEQAVICYIKDNDKKQVLLINKKNRVSVPERLTLRVEELNPEKCRLRQLLGNVRKKWDSPRLTPEYVGDLFFIFKNGHSLRGFVYTAEAFEGDMIETDEAEPFWCENDRIPYDKMWADDALWLEKALNGN